MGSFSNYVLDKFLAPKVSEFVAADVPDLSGMSKRWLDNHFLNSVLRAAYKEKVRAYVFNYLRRVEGAFKSHAEARDATQRFLEGSRQSLSAYMNALLHWEAFLAQGWMAYELLRRPSQTRVFQPGDGSVEQRLHDLYTASKHADSWIHGGKLPSEGTVVIWLENEGLKSQDASLSWEETGAVLENLAGLADVLEDPLEARNRLQPDAGAQPS